MSPPNVLITKYGEVKIVDFGLAKASSQLEKSEPGIIKGKFSYLSPEAALGQEVDKRTDIFAVGIILWELLAGQRLFLGDTDFQTVKKVQVAQVPPISQINRKVPPELERIVNKALAKDMLARYGTSRELGQDLSRFMFSYGEPISSYDVATIVQGTMREKQRVRPPQGSIIDKLIEEALFEFTSLKEDGAPASGNMKTAAAAPLNTDGFVDPTNWANEIGISEVNKRPGFDPVRASLPPDIFEHGNLSALEDAEPMPPSHPPPPVSHGQHHSQPPGSMPPSGMSQMGSGQHNVQRSGGHPQSKNAGGPGGAAIGVVLFLVVAAAAGAAWFTGLIPHH
jgi:serine/threonine-protein kinase